MLLHSTSPPSLLVSSYTPTNANLYKISLADATQISTVNVKKASPNFDSFLMATYDGIVTAPPRGDMTHRDDTTLYIASNSVQNALLKLVSNDGWDTAFFTNAIGSKDKVFPGTVPGCVTPTAIAFVQSTMFASCTNGFSGPYDIQRFDFPNPDLSVPTYSIGAPGLIPEGLAYVQGVGWAWGSIGGHGINVVNTASGSVSPLYNPYQVGSTVGTAYISGQSGQGRVLSTSTLWPVSKPNGGLWSFHVRGGDTQFYCDLTHQGPNSGNSPRLYNDVAVDAEGFAYVTESIQGIVFRVTPDGKFDRAITAHALSSECCVKCLGEYDLCLNGIAAGNGFVLAGKSGMTTDAGVYRINTTDFSVYAVNITGGNVEGLDGMRLTSDGKTLIIVGGGNVKALQSTDGFHSAMIVNVVSTGPYCTDVTTGDFGPDGNFYVSCPNGFSATGPYYIQKISFPSPNAFVPPSSRFQPIIPSHKATLSTAIAGVVLGALGIGLTLIFGLKVRSVQRDVDFRRTMDTSRGL